MKVCILFALIFSQSSFALKFTWFGTTTTLIEDQGKVLLFDPYFTHPSIWDVLFHKDISSDMETVKKWLNKANVKNINYVLVNHSHYDHIFDLPSIASLYPAQIYGSVSTQNYALGQGVPKNRVHPIKDGSSLELAPWKINVFPGNHAAHFAGYMAMNGIMPSSLKLPTSAWNITRDTDLIFHLKTKKYSILFHPFGGATPGLDYSKLKADILFLGIAKRESTQKQIDKIVKNVSPKIIIPMHWDNFFIPLKEKPKELPFIDLKEWIETMKKNYPQAEVIIPSVGLWVDI